MNLLAGLKPKIVKANLKYNEGAPSIRRYDSCYYQIKAVPEQELSKIKKVISLKIYLQVTKAQNMNVYLYGGKDRFNADVSIVNDNQPVKVGSNYTISIDSGMLLVAYPNKDSETDFEFKIWVADVTEGVIERIMDLNFHGQDG